MRFDNKKLFLFSVIIMIVLLTGFSPADNKEKVKAIKTEGITNVELQVSGANIVLETNTDSTPDIFLYGKASADNYKIVTSINGATLVISCDYIGTEQLLAKEAGILIQIPETVNQVDVSADDAGVSVNEVDAVLNLTTSSSYVNIEKKVLAKKITIDSSNDAYSLSFRQVKKDISMEEYGSVIELSLAKTIKNLSLDLTNKNGLITLPKNFKKNTKLGSGKPVISLENTNGIFELLLKK